MTHAFRSSSRDRTTPPPFATDPVRPAIRVVNAVAICLGGVVLTFAIVASIQVYTRAPGPFVDWRTYESAASRLIAGQPIYSTEQVEGPYRPNDVVVFGYTYPPSSVPLFLPFRGYPLGLAGWMSVNLGLLLTALWALVSQGWPRHRFLVFALALIGLACFPPFLDGMVAVNVNIGIAGAIGWVAVGLPDRPAGLMGAMGATLKVFPGAIAFASVVNKRRAFLTAVAAFASLVAATIPIVGFHAWADFVAALTNAVPDCVGENRSIACIAQPVVGPLIGSLVGLGIGVLAVAGLLRTRSPLRMAALTGVAVMAPANNLHTHYWVITFVLGVAFLATCASRFTSAARIR